MKSEFLILQGERLLEKIDALLGVQDYLDSKAKRETLSSIYLQALNLGSDYPPRPLTMNLVTASELNKKVSTWCGTCVRPAVMRKHIKSAKNQLIEYASLLRPWVMDTEYTNLSKDVHDLRPNT